MQYQDVFFIRLSLRVRRKYRKEQACKRERKHFFDKESWHILIVGQLLAQVKFDLARNRAGMVHSLP
jgi:hypothetical protein